MSRERAVRRGWITAARSRRLYDAPMTIVVFWIETAGVPAHRELGGAELLLDAVSGGRLPGGEPYEFNKRHRGDVPMAPA